MAFTDEERYAVHVALDGMIVRRQSSRYRLSDEYRKTLYREADNVVSYRYDDCMGLVRS